MDPFEQSIQKVVGYALKYFSRCGDDLWDCIVEECQKGSINNRINILYFLDSLCEACLLAKSHPHSELSSSSSSTLKPTNATENSSFYVDLVSRDLGKIVEHVVPEGRQGLPNLTSTKQILENWRNKRVIDPQKIDDVMTTLNERKSSVDADASTSATPASSLSRGEIFKRIEEDRERHKRLRERRWVQPVSYLPYSHTQHLAAFLPLTDDKDGAEELTLDIEFENEWDATSDWNEDDVEAAMEEDELCFSTREGGEGEGEEPMDLS